METMLSEEAKSLKVALEGRLAGPHPWKIKADLSILELTTWATFERWHIKRHVDTLVAKKKKELLAEGLAKILVGEDVDVQDIYRNAESLGRSEWEEQQSVSQLQAKLSSMQAMAQNYQQQAAKQAHQNVAISSNNRDLAQALQNHFGNYNNTP